jgi:hypothetical protein
VICGSVGFCVVPAQTRIPFDFRWEYKVLLKVAIPPQGGGKAPNKIVFFVFENAFLGISNFKYYKNWGYSNDKVFSPKSHVELNEGQLCLSVFREFLPVEGNGFQSA